MGCVSGSLVLVLPGDSLWKPSTGSPVVGAGHVVSGFRGGLEKGSGMLSPSSLWAMLLVVILMCFGNTFPGVSSLGRSRFSFFSIVWLWCCSCSSPSLGRSSDLLVRESGFTPCFPG